MDFANLRTKCELELENILTIPLLILWAFCQAVMSAQCIRYFCDGGKSDLGIFGPFSLV